MTVSMTMRMVGCALLLTPTAARAAPVWVGDMETGDTSQWDGELFGEHITMVQMPAQGSYAAHIELTNDAIWPGNMLRRVELHHSPAAGRTDEGAELYFAWSFYLPEVLPTDPSHQIGYWESNQSYQQMMAFTVSGEHISFVTRQPTNVTHWEQDGAVTAGVWHRIAMHILWSKSAGSVDVWFDGIQVVTAGAAETLNDDNDHFTQVGLLRGNMDIQEMPVIVLDDAAEGDSLADVNPEPPGMGGGGAGGSSSTGSSSGGAPAQSSASVATSGSGAAAINPEAPAGDAGGCGCTLPGRSDEAPAWTMLALLGMMLRRRTPAKRRS